MARANAFSLNECRTMGQLIYASASVAEMRAAFADKPPRSVGALHGSVRRWLKVNGDPSSPPPPNPLKARRSARVARITYAPREKSDQDAEDAAAEGSLALLKALVAYHRQYHPASDVARLAA